MYEGQDSWVTHIPWRSAWLIVTVVLTVIGFGGVPDDLRTWSRWFESIDSWIDQGWVRILAVIMAALTLLVKVVDLRPRLFDRKKLTADGEIPTINDTETDVIIAQSSTDESEVISSTDNEPVVQKNQTQLTDAVDQPSYIEESPEDILKGNDELTNVAIERKSRSYIGKMMRVSGIVWDVELRELSVARNSGAVVHFYTDGDSGIVAHISDEWKDKALSIKKGTRVEVIGKIGYVSSNLISLDECQILPPDLSVQNVSSNSI